LINARVKTSPSAAIKNARGRRCCTVPHLRSLRFVIPNGLPPCKESSFRYVSIKKQNPRVGWPGLSRQGYLRRSPAAKDARRTCVLAWQKTRGVARRAQVLRSAKSAWLRVTSPVGETGRDCSFRRTNCEVRPSLSRSRAVHWDSISTRPSIPETTAGPRLALAAPARFGQRSG